MFKYNFSSRNFQVYSQFENIPRRRSYANKSDYERTFVKRHQTNTAQDTQTHVTEHQNTILYVDNY